MCLPWWFVLHLLAIFLCFSRVSPQSIRIAVSTTTGDSSPAVFDTKSIERTMLLSEAKFFCNSINGSADCAEQLFNEVLDRRSQGGIWNFPNLVLNHYTVDLVAAECQSWSKRGYTNESDCISQADTAIRSVKVATAFPTADKLIRTVHDNEIVPMVANWRDDIEGNTIGFIRKVLFLQAMADDKRVERIAEIGFNLGHSTINWLLANPVASVLAFDVTRRLYTSAAINAVSTLFPARTVSLVTGDSTLSVPNYTRMVNAGAVGNSVGGPKFNLIFIDGGHTYDVALADIINMRALANQTYHALIIDDGLSVDVRGAWDYAEHTLKIVRLTQMYSASFSWCVNMVSVTEGVLAGSFDFVPCAGAENEHTSDDLIIGEYLW